MMNPEIKAKWVAALEGEYADKHTTEMLAKYEWDGPDDGDSINLVGYCCLGVLMKIQGADIPNEADILETWNIPEKYCAGLTTSNLEELANLNDRSKDFKAVVERIKQL